jgi:subtilisin-like proprotein convertase family protein
MVAINDASTTTVGKATPYPSVAPIDGLVGRVSKVTLRLKGYAHQWPTEVDMMLVAPTGERAMVMSDQGPLSAVSGIDLTFDDSATEKLAWGTAITSGKTYRPSDTGAGTDLGDVFPAPAPQPPAAYSQGFSAFDGVEPNGDWALYVTDDAAGKIGSIFSWSITVTSTGPATYPATVEVAGASGSVTDVDVHLDDFSHEYPEDVDLLLVGPQGQQATLLSDVPDTSDVTDVDLALDDAASAAVTKPITSGTYRPTNLGAGADDFPAPAPTASGSASLSVFNGTDPNGTWRLYAADDGPGGLGEIKGWSLRITTTSTVPTSTPTPTAGSGGRAGDTVSPRVSSTRPVAGAKAVRRGADVAATFDEAVRRATVTDSSAFLVRKGSTRHLAATVTYRPATRQVVIDPARRLRAHTTYRAVISTAVKDRAGNRLDQNPTKTGLQPKTWRFATR